MIAYHFCAIDDKGHAMRRDGKIIKKGERERYTGTLEMCAAGLHASKHPFDALEYAPGPMLRRVDCSGEMLHQKDKLVCSERKELARIDATSLLRLCAADFAERALMRERKAGREPDKRSWAVIEAARQFANGKISREQLDDARDDARDAHSSAAPAAALAASAALAAARDDARVAAWDAARDDDWDDEKKWQRRHFAAMVRKAMP